MISIHDSFFYYEKKAEQDCKQSSHRVEEPRRKARRLELAMVIAPKSKSMGASRVYAKIMEARK